MAHGMELLAQRQPLRVSLVVNTGDDMELHGLHVAPDLDTVMYTLAGLADPERGWGVRDETWSAAQMLERYGAPTWFRIGDHDLATHVARSQGLRQGDRLTEVTARLAAALGIGARLLPMTDDPVRTEVRTADGWMEFQDWFVRRRHADSALEVRFRGVETAQPTAEVQDAIRQADIIVVAPSNPFVSVGTILAVPGVRDALLSAAAPVVAVSPIVGGAALRGPAAAMMSSLAGQDATAVGVARHYAERYPNLLDAMVIDDADAADAPAIEALGMRVLVTATVISEPAARERLAAEVVEAFGRQGNRAMADSAS